MKEYSDEMSIRQSKASNKGGKYLDEDLYIIDHLSKDSFPKNKRKVKGYLFILCESGNLDCEIECKTYHGHRNSFFLLHTNDCIENITFPTKTFSGKALFIASKGLEHIVDTDKRADFLQKITETHHLLLSEYTANLFKCNFFIAQNEFTNITEKSKENVYNLIRINLQYIFEKIPTPKSNLKEDKTSRSVGISQSIELQAYDKFMEYLKSPIIKYIRIKDFCEEHYIHYYSLERITQKKLGCTPYKFLREKLTHAICAYLNNADASLNIKDIAKLFNFNSASAFSRYFKKEIGCSPKDYLKKNKILQARTALDTTLDQI